MPVSIIRCSRKELGQKANKSTIFQIIIALMNYDHRSKYLPLENICITVPEATSRLTTIVSSYTTTVVAASYSTAVYQVTSCSRFLTRCLGFTTHLCQNREDLFPWHRVSKLPVQKTVTCY